MNFVSWGRLEKTKVGKIVEDSYIEIEMSKSYL